MRDLPNVSVVVNTYNRAGQVGEAVESALSQAGVELELVVVDDGSTDETPAVLAGLTDARMRCVRHSNRGLSASRNVGAREARGEWLLFLDDDDRLCEGALEALLTATGDPSCRVVVGGVRYVDRDGQTLQERTPVSLSDALAGSFLISRTLFHEAGGYLEGMPCSHQTELFLRVGQVLDDSVRAVSYVAEPVVEVQRRPAAGRPEQSPGKTYFGARWLLARHPDQYRNRRTRATMETLAAVNGMRIGREGDARRRFASAVRHDPLSPKRYLRLAGAIVTPIGRRIWLRQWDTAPGAERSLDGVDSLFLPWRYQENPPKPEALAEHDSGSRAPIHRLAYRLARTRGLAPVVDIGSIAGALDDQSIWDQILRLKPQLVVCADLVQKVPDPRGLLSGIHHVIGDRGVALISTPDRARLRPEAAMGPPTEPFHSREWTADQFALLLESCGFEVRRVIRRRSSMAFLVRAIGRHQPPRRDRINEENSAARTSQV